jgi:peptide deformylase
MMHVKAIMALGQTKLINKLLKMRNKTPVILVHPHPVLSRRAKEIDFEKTSLEQLTAIVRKMGAALKDVGYGNRLGIAAPQIGISKRIMVVQGAVMVNPTWTPSKAPKEIVVEGCYSLPHKTYEVHRASYGWAKWRSINGEERSFKLSGLNAIVFQHELDHLDGKCCVDVGVLLEDKSKEMKKYIVLEEVTINGVTHQKDAIISLEYKVANLKSLKGKIAIYDGRDIASAPVEPLVKPVPPAPTV